jgi:hypothetical protein
MHSSTVCIFVLLLGCYTFRHRHHPHRAHTKITYLFIYLFIYYLQLGRHPVAGVVNTRWQELTPRFWCKLSEEGDDAETCSC